MELSESVFKRLVESLNGKTAIVPLSGGYDSRYILSMLKKVGYTNVVCYTYGYSTNTEETGISKNVAKKLGYKHFYVNQDDLFWDEFVDDEIVKKYLKSNYNICHTPHIQEIRALELLKKSRDFPETGVIIPGFCGDLFSGSYTFSLKQNSKHNYSLNELIEYIMFNHFTSFSNLKIDKYVLFEELSNFFQIRESQIFDFDSFNEVFGYWFCSHKVSKYVIPSIKAYETLGYEWRIPLWDKELTEYWYNIPISLKQTNSLYEYSLMQLLFNDYNIAYKKKDNEGAQIERQHRKLIKKYFKKIQKIC